METKSRPETEADAQLETSVREHLQWDNRLDASGVDVRACGGEAELSGHVPTPQARDAAIASTWAVNGVTAVDDRLTVHRPAGAEDAPSDADARTLIEQLLRSRTDLEASDVTVTVKDGVAHLSGTLPSYWRRQLVERLVEEVGGLTGLRSALTVQLERDVPDREIAGAVRAALRRDARTREERVDVEVEGGTVSLSGVVPSRTAHEAAEEAASYTEGVTDVQNGLAISITDEA